jgi:hypothetical protein
MSLRPQSALPPVPEDTARIAQTAFRRGSPYLLLQDRLGPIFADTAFADLCRLLAQAETDPAALEPANCALNALPADDRRQVLASFAAFARAA